MDLKLTDDNHLHGVTSIRQCCEDPRATAHGGHAESICMNSVWITNALKCQNLKLLIIFDASVLGLLIYTSLPS